MDALQLSEDHVDFMRDEGWLTDSKGVNGGGGCWTPRRVDSMAILVVDALRFDFARDHLPLSVGSRLFPGKLSNSTRSKGRGYSQLYQFVADPPTVTMQRLKGLTTGGLPTFADISGSFGGASIDEDSWVEQLKNTPWMRRHHISVGGDGSKKPLIGFVGDDTWVDLFPTQFDDSHPYPSFNTRDLDTVDNGCLMHLPRLLDGLLGLKKLSEFSSSNNKHNNATSFELIVAHFLGVDHVGHTYGPNDPHMERKLNQMDEMLSHTLDAIDDAPEESCIVAFVLGDHGMTEDGNHGGGTSEEVNAGLFVHFSPGCHYEEESMQQYRIERLDGGEIGLDSVRAFESIHQIDLVPTISLLLGLPIPYANIGGLVPDLLPTPRTGSGDVASPTPHSATALALNAAQVWSYLDAYSKISSDLPVDRMKELKELLDSATLVFKEALASSQKQALQHANEGKQHHDSIAYRQACGLFKLFLAESTDLGKRVWTQFNEGGMMFGIGILVVAWIMTFPLWKRNVRNELWAVLSWRRSDDSMKGHIKCAETASHNKLVPSASSMQSFRQIELIAAIAFMIFQCGVLTFGNSYIDHEREVVTFFLAILCLLVFRRWYFATAGHTSNAGLQNSVVYLPLMVAFSARANDVFVTGHGLDPSIRMHLAHHSVVFLSSLLVLILLRLRWFCGSSSRSALIDVVAIICLAFSWWEKRSRDHSRNGFIMARCAIALIFAGLLHSCYAMYRRKRMTSKGGYRSDREWTEMTQLASFRAMMFITIVTGPSTASTAVLMVVQTAALSQMMEAGGNREIDAPVMAALWRLAIRHVFFATNHHCSFNRLHFSAAFVATETFEFHIAGASLFMNTFGWEIIGTTLVLVLSRTCRGKARRSVWTWFCFYQWTETVASCMSVSVMKRHLMVWAIFAPRFMFAAVFTGLTLFLCFVDIVVSIVTTSSAVMRKQLV